MLDVAVVTANFGGFDVPRGAVEQTVDADWYAFHDEYALNWPGPWHPTAIFGWPDSPRLQAKYHKLTPWRMIEGDYRWIVWLDANMEVHNPRFLEEAIKAADDEGAPVTSWRHPRRRNVWIEAMASARLAKKYGDAGLIEQVEAYRGLGFPDDRGLWACGTLVWNLDDERSRVQAEKLGETWLRECERWSIQDQLSLPFTAWALGLKVGTFPVGQIGSMATVDGRYRITNDWLFIHQHNRED